MRKLPVWLGGAIASLALTTAAHAACDVQKPGYELTGDEAEAVYDCLKADLQAGYQKGPKRWIPEAFVKDYPGWTKASAFPADNDSELRWRVHWSRKRIWCWRMSQPETSIPRPVNGFWESCNP